MGAAYDPLAPDVRAYDLDAGVLGEKIFRTAPGAPREEDLRDGRFAEFDWATWDTQLERDVAAGKLTDLADRALRDHTAGRSKPL